MLCVFGFGLLIGSLVILLIDIGIFGKLFSEVLENIDEKLVEGLCLIGVGVLVWICWVVILQVVLVIML